MSGAVLAGMPPDAAMAGVHPVRIRAVCFDAFAIFDPRAVLRAADAISPDLGAAWFQKIFADTWLRTSARQYADFATVAAQALAEAAPPAAMEAALAAGERLVAGFSQLGLCSDVRSELPRLRAAGLRLALLSNLTQAMLRANLRRHGLEALFDEVISTDEARTFKPSPEAYALGVHRLRLTRPEILFAPFAAWDAAGSAWFGYPTAWVNRAGQRPLGGAPPVLTGADLRVVMRRAGLSA